jgi:hypothetical protein
MKLSVISYHGFRPSMLTLNSERRESAIRFEDNFLNVFDTRISRAGDQIMFERLDRSLDTLRERLDTAVVQISDVSTNLMPSRGALDEISETDALDETANKKLSCDEHPAYPNASRHSIKVR